MKKIILGICLSFLALNINAQETEKERRNDIMIDPVLLIAVPLINVSYERLLNKDVGLGLNAVISLNDDLDHFRQFSPFVRYYLGRNYASGFFLEGFVPITSEEDYYVLYNFSPNGYYTTTEKTGNVTTVGIGFGIGGKWVVKERLVLEISGGIARRFNSSNNEFRVSEATPKLMAGVGYRF